MKGWDLPPNIRAAMLEPIGRDTPTAVLEALRDDVANRATIFPDAELARQALDALIETRTATAFGHTPERRGTAAAGIVVDDSDDCLGCQ